jgi:hypothetical protein
LLIRPKDFVISCADANTELRALHWQSWTTSGATGSATYRYNDCTPYCAAGHFHDDPATVALSGPAHEAHGLEFTSLVLHYKDAGKTKALTFSLLTH